MTVGIIGAMEPEVSGLIAKLADHRCEQVGFTQFHFGTLGSHEVVVAQCGIGKVAAGAITALMITCAHASCIINTGCAGAVSPSLKIGDIVFSSSAAYHYADLTAFGYPMGQMAGQDRLFNADPLLMAKAGVAAGNLPELKGKVRQGLVVSGDQFINTREKRAAIAAIYPEALVAEMEGAAVAQVAAACKVPFLVIRAVSDEASEGTTANYDEFMPKAAALSERLVTGLINLL